MKPLSLDELRELAPAHVMGTLSLEEQRAFELALRDPAIAAELEPELEAHREAIDYLASSQPVAPPPALKERVMARLGTQGAAPAMDRTREGSVPGATSAPAAAPAGRPALAPTTSMPAISPTPTRASAPARSRAGWWAAGAAAVALAASVLFAVELRSRVGALESELAEQAVRSSRADSALAERERTLAALLDGGNDLTLVRLSANQPTDGPGLQVFWNTREGRAVVSATGLKPVASDRAYCLWIIQNGTPVPVKLFTVDAQGRALVKDIVLPTDLAGIAAFALTEEPATGSPKPTMTPFLVGAVPPRS